MSADPLAVAPEPEPDRPLPAVGTPRHVAIIMDGNGRWASTRMLPRTLGHRKGVDTVRRIVRHAGRRGLELLTLFAFSRENWNRPKAEVAELMLLLRRYIRSDLEELVAAGVTITVIGDRADLDEDLRRLIHEAESRTAANNGLRLVLAFNYSGRDEILRATQRLVAAALRGDVQPEAIDEALFSAHLDTRELPDPDLVIRTSGELRISNFLLWQSAYAEYVFPPAFWPDFDEAMFDAALAEFATRQRRFGALSIAKP